MNTKQFTEILNTVSDGWNEGNAKKAADCFTEDALYSEPPDQQFCQGREDLFIYFGGNRTEPKWMKLTWHNISFNEDTQVGMGEYTFEMSDKNHGVVVVEVENEKIKKWREYQWTGDLTYEEFLDPNGKEFQYTVKDIS